MILGGTCLRSPFVPARRTLGQRALLPRSRFAAQTTRPALSLLTFTPSALSVHRPRAHKDGVHAAQAVRGRLDGEHRAPPLPLDPLCGSPSHRADALCPSYSDPRLAPPSRPAPPRRDPTWRWSHPRRSDLLLLRPPRRPFLLVSLVAHLSRLAPRPLSQHCPSLSPIALCRTTLALVIALLARRTPAFLSLCNSLRLSTTMNREEPSRRLVAELYQGERRDGRGAQGGREQEDDDDERWEGEKEGTTRGARKRHNEEETHARRERNS